MIHQLHQLGHLLFVIAGALIAFASVRSWYNRKAGSDLVMLIGASAFFLGALSGALAPYFHPPIAADGTEAVIVELNLLDLVSRILILPGFLLFSLGFTATTFKQCEGRGA